MMEVPALKREEAHKMVDQKEIHRQLKKIKFGGSPWNQAEIRELPKIIHEGEKISECVNGFYEGGVALLVATEMRVLLIDKKPLRFLTVEDLRFDMINEIDYSHRLLNATITISTGGKTLKFSSTNHQRLRSLINLVQEHMSTGKKSQSEAAETQQQHLQEINKQLQMYLMAQHQHLQRQLDGQTQANNIPKPSPQLSDYLFAHQLLDQFQQESGGMPQQSPPVSAPDTLASNTEKVVRQAQVVSQPSPSAPQAPSQDELLAAARQEVFGHNTQAPQLHPDIQQTQIDNPAAFFKGLEINPLRIAYSKLPMMLRNRKFGRPSFHAHSQQQVMPPGNQPAV